MSGKRLAGLAAFAISLLLVLIIRPAEKAPQGSLQETEGSEFETWDEPEQEHWHIRYVRDHCERCPQCCTGPIEEDKCGNCPGDKCDCFKDEYHVWRPNSWLPTSPTHCANCPGSGCICIKDGNGEWMLNETISE